MGVEEATDQRQSSLVLFFTRSQHLLAQAFRHARFRVITVPQRDVMRIKIEICCSCQVIPKHAGCSPRARKDRLHRRNSLPLQTR